MLGIELWPPGLAMNGAFALPWILLSFAGPRDTSLARRALEARANELTLRALEPGSTLACLDGVVNPTIEDACEKALFASPEKIAAAVSYVDARLALLADGL